MNNLTDPAEPDLDPLSGARSARSDRSEPGRPGELPHAHLRRVTRALHEDVERAYAGFDLRTREGLTGFLLCQAAAVLPLEEALTRPDIAALVPDWPERRRGPVLRADLARLDIPAPHLSTAPGLPTLRHALGALYVLEGSRLGGRLLQRQVAASPDPRIRAADGFLRHRLERGWPSFLAILDAAATCAQDLALLVEGATMAFARFLAAVESFAPPPVAPVPTRSGLDHHAHA